MKMTRTRINTTFGQMPGNWWLAEGQDWPEWEASIEEAVDETFAKYFPGGDVYRVGYSDIHATVGDEFPGSDFLENEDWLETIMSEANEVATERAQEGI